MTAVYESMKCSLSQIQDYGSSDSEEETIIPALGARLPAPNLPAYKIFQSITREPPPSSTGKIRNFPHEPGNWATYIHVPINNIDRVSQMVKDLVQHISSIELELEIAEDFHISLTRTVVLRHHWIKDFVTSAGQLLCDIKPFFISLSSFRVYLNESKTRTFVALVVQEGTKDLKEIVKLLDMCLAEYNLPPFYNSPSFHMSILSCPGNKVDEITLKLDKIPKFMKSFTFLHQVNYLKCNSGNKTFSLNLKNKVGDRYGDYYFYYYLIVHYITHSLLVSR